MAEYQVSFAAEQDIFDIVVYTAERWGAGQARVYSGKLECCMEKLALGEGTYKQLDEFKPPVRVRQCEHHYIFGQQVEGEAFMIIAVLHERMDIISRLAGRLGG